MPITLPSSFNSREEPNSSDDYLWFIEILVKKAARTSGPVYTAGLVFRICSDSQAHTWPVSNPTPPGAWAWQPFNFDISPVEQTEEGDLPSVQLSVDNTGRVLMPTLHSGDTLEGNPVTMYLVPRSALSIAYPNHQYQKFEFQIASVSADSESITFRLERANFFSRQAPQDRYVARRCRWQFGSDNCGYIINSLAAYTACKKTIADCTLRGADHESRGLAVVHPGRFGGFPGIPKQQ